MSINLSRDIDEHRIVNGVKLKAGHVLTDTEGRIWLVVTPNGEHRSHYATLRLMNADSKPLDFEFNLNLDTFKAQIETSAETTITFTEVING